MKNAQPGGEMTGFLRLGNQDIFSGIEVTGGKMVLTDAAGLGIEVNQKQLVHVALAIN